LGYTRIKSSYQEVETEVTYFVPMEDDLEIWRLEIHNKSSAKMNLKVFSYIEFCLWQALGDQNDLQYIQNIAVTKMQNNIIYYSTFDRKPGFAYFSSSQNITSFDCDREDFIGSYRSEANPLAVENGKCFNSIALGGNPIASTCSSINLEPDEKEIIFFVLGVTDKIERAKEVIKNYHNKAYVDNQFEKLKQSWESYLGNLLVDTPSDKMNLMLNVWNPYQCKVTFDWSRYVSFYETGIGRGIGFRDSSQDSMAISYVLPLQVRQRLLDLARNQFENGNVYHVYFPITKEGGFPDYSKPEMPFFSDDHLWLILATCDYVKQTGDITILDEEVEYVEGSKSNLYNHLEQAIYFTRENLGPNGFPIQGTADWNDTLNLPGPNNAGESVWTAMQYHLALKELSELSDRYKQHQNAQKLFQLAKRMKDHINKFAWDGNWYLRAFTDSGVPVGSSKCEEGQIFLNSQTWAVISDIAPFDRAIESMENVRLHLDTKHGLMLLTPPYTRFYPELGGISTLHPGLKENGSIFCHTNPWAIIAECKLGRGNLAFKYYLQIAPPTRNEIADVHRAEPYIYSQMIAGRDHPKFGMAKNSWLTGTAAWNLKATMEYILGVRPTYEGLVIDPCIPSSWSHFTIIRRFRNAIYDFDIKNPDNVSKGVISIMIDGEKVEGNKIPDFRDEKKHKIIATMG
jgi:cellobiose phosphorylase